MLEQALGLPYVYVGQLFREEAVRRGMTLAEYNALAQEDEAVDRSIDDRQLDLLRGGGVILEGRLAGWLAQRHDLQAFKVWVVCDEAERIRRLVERDGGDRHTQREAMRDRVRREADRYGRYYGADLSDLSFYDLVLDSTTVSPDRLRDMVLEGFDQQR